MLEEIIPIVTSSLLDILGIVIAGIAGTLGLHIRQWFIENDKQQIAKMVVQWAEQAYRGADGPARFEKAKDKYIVLANKRGIKVTENEIDVLIEQAVLGLQKGFKNDIEEEDIAPLFFSQKQ